MKNYHATDSGAPLRRLAIVLLTAFTLTGVARDDIKVYRVPKTPAAPGLPAGQLPAGHPPMTGGGAGEAALEQLKYTTPAGWTELPPSQMRVASFAVTNASGKFMDVSVIPIPGMAGGDAPNVNRWREQVGLAALSPEELKQSAQAVKAGPEVGELYDLAGKNPRTGDAMRILAVIVRRTGTAWFFKATGDDALVAEQKPKFIEFLQSCAFAPGGGMAGRPGPLPPMTDGTLPSGHPDISKPPTLPAAAMPAPTAGPRHENQPKWEVPSGWKDMGSSQFLIAKFLLDDSGKTAVNVSMSAGDAGGLAGNLNRWRGQLGLPPYTSEELVKAVRVEKVGGTEITFVEMSGTDARTGQLTKLVGAMVPQSGSTWFYKLMGEAKVVAAQTPAFTEFVKTVKY